jgi:hypothetical protein
MSTGRDVSSIRLHAPSELPELTVDAARVLLRILRKAHDQHLAADKFGAADARAERGVA